MARFEIHSERTGGKPPTSFTDVINKLGTAAMLLERKKSNDNSLSTDHRLKQAIACPCKAHNFWLRPFLYGTAKELGIICIKCNRTALGKNLLNALHNWNERKFFC